MPVSVWIMIVVSYHGGLWRPGPEFTSKEKCEMAAKVMLKNLEEFRWSISNSSTLCVKIDK